MRKTILISALLCVCLAGCEEKDPYKKATFAYLVKDYPAAYTGFTALAAQGNADAEQYLGMMFLDGKGVVQDGAQALSWYQKAAEHGKEESQLVLAAAYYNGGSLVAQDFAQARHWYLKAAANGNRNAQLQLAKMDHSGQGSLVDDVAAYKWLVLVADTSRDSLRDNRVVMDAVRMQDDLSRRLTAAQIAKAEGLAEIWRTQHSVAGDGN